MYLLYLALARSSLAIERASQAGTSSYKNAREAKFSLRGTMPEFNERDGGETPRYGENAAEVAKVRGMIPHLLRADSEVQAVRRLPRLCSAVIERAWIEPAFLSVQECRSECLMFIQKDILLERKNTFLPCGLLE
jgi:hypothetical protein